MALVVGGSCVSYEPGIEVPLLVRVRAISRIHEVGNHRVALAHAYLRTESVSLEPCPRSVAMLNGSLANGSLANGSLANGELANWGLANRVLAHDTGRSDGWDVIHMSGLPPLHDTLFPAPGEYCGVRVVLNGEGNEPSVEVDGRVDGSDFSIQVDESLEWVVPIEPVEISMESELLVELQLDAIAWAPTDGRPLRDRVRASFHALVLPHSD